MPIKSWTGKRLLSRPNELDEDGLVKLRDHPEMTGRGIYMISIEDGSIDYPKKGGKVIYIGKATSVTTIKSRLLDHRSKREGSNPNLYAYFKYKTLKIQFAHTGSTDNNLARREINRFQDHFDEFGNVPVANRQAPVVI